MAAFEYSALDPNGRQKRGVIEADSARQARSVLRERSLMPTEVVLSKGKRSPKTVGMSFGGTLRGLNRVLFTRQLATLIASSLPIEEALLAVAEQSEKQSIKAMIMGIRSKVLEGFTLAGSLAEHPTSFNELYRSTVAAGEQSGYLDKVLDNLAEYEERQFSATRNIEMALFYPVALLLVAFSIVGGLMAFVVPDMVSVIVDQGQQLPWFTVVLIAITDFLAELWWALGLLIIGVVLGIRYAFSLPTQRLHWDRTKFSLPLISGIVRSANAARYANTLSILTRSGVPLVEAMLIAAEVVSNHWLRRGLKDATQSVSEGSSLKISLSRIGVMPPMMLHMVGAGEQSGELDDMLYRVAQFQQQEVERVVATLVKLFEPLMLLLMGALVLFIVMAIMLPMLSMNQLV